MMDHRAAEGGDDQMVRSTRAQRLAEALGASVKHDFGYRAILHNAEHGYMRYHVTEGLHTVELVGKRYMSKEQLLTVADIDKLLASKRPPVVKVLDTLADALGGHVVEVFSAGGGVAYLPGDSVHVRYHPIGGLSIVEQTLHRWVSREKILGTMQLNPILRKGPEGLKEIKHVVDRSVERFQRAAAGRDGEAEAAAAEAL